MIKTSWDIARFHSIILSSLRFVNFDSVLTGIPLVPSYHSHALSHTMEGTDATLPVVRGTRPRERSWQSLKSRDFGKAASHVVNQGVRVRVLVVIIFVLDRCWMRVTILRAVDNNCYSKQVIVLPNVQSINKTNYGFIVTGEVHFTPMIVTSF